MLKLSDANIFMLAYVNSKNLDNKYYANEYKILNIAFVNIW